MGDKCIALTTATRLPPELYSEIAAHFPHPWDRPVLRSLALVNSTWRDESQRVLFRSLGDGFGEPFIIPSIMRAHVLFLEAILADPVRLGSFVRSYAQIRMTKNTENETGSSAIYDGRLWDLTLQALPALTNLQHLAFVPTRTNATFPATVVLSRCPFRLTHLVWGCEIAGGSDSTPFAQFLLNNGAYLHHLGRALADKNLPALSPGACPALSSASCGYTSVAHVTDGRGIVALRLSRPDNDTLFALEPITIEIDPAAAGVVRYLTMDVYSPHPSFSNLILLELWIWNIRTPQAFCHLQSLQTLVLHENGSYSTPDISGDENIRDQVVEESCKRCPKLTHIIHELSWHWEAVEHQYTSFTISREQGRVVGVHRKDVTVLREWYASWWDIYNLSLIDGQCV